MASVLPARLRRKRPPAITASATEVPAAPNGRSVTKKHQPSDWQLEVMDYFHVIPELKKAGRWASNMMSKVNLFVAAVGPDGITPVDLDAVDPQTGAPLVDLPPALKLAAQMELGRLDANTLGGHAALLRHMTVQLDFPGECWLIGYGPRPELDGRERRERWEIRAINEVVQRDDAWYVLDGSSRDGRRLDPDLDTKIRLWEPDPWHQERADSNIRAVITECRLLQALSGKMYAETMSRQSAGAITVPKGLTQQKVKSAAQRAEGDQSVEQSKFSYDMVNSITRGIADPSDVAAVARMIIEGERDDLKPDVLRTIDWGREDNGETDEKIAMRIERIGHAINLPIEVMLGHKDTTFNNAEQITEDEFTQYLEPRCVLHVENLTDGFLWPQLRDNPDYAWSDSDIEQLFVWYDPSALFPEPDPADSADEAFDRRAIGWSGYRKLKGIPEDYAPDDDEIAAINAAAPTRTNSTATATTDDDEQLAIAAAARFGVTPAQLLARLVADGWIDPRRPLALGPPGDRAGPAAGDAHHPRQAPALTAAAESPGRRLVDIDRLTRERVHAAADAAMRRALERAGNLIKTRANGHRTVLANVEPALRARRLGPAIVADAGLTEADLLGGAFDDLARHYSVWLDNAHDEANSVWTDTLGHDWADPERVETRAEDARSRSVEVLTGLLAALAVARLYDPRGIDPRDAEELVPVGLVRHALAVAGGATDIVTFGNAYTAVSATDDGIGGVATGDMWLDTFRAEGGTVEGYRWVYGAAARDPFTPHRQLSGTVFQNFDDQKLRNTRAWPPFAYYIPGDHPGCRCDAEPVLIGPRGDVQRDF